MIAATPPGQSAPPSEPPGTLLLLVRHSATPTTGMVLPGRAVLKLNSTAEPLSGVRAP